MSNTSTTNESKPQLNHGFGGKLRSARTSRGYSLDAVAQELNILKRTLQALEEEDFSNLPPFANACGFMANYAKFLELDSDDLVSSFKAAYPESLRPKIVTSPVKPMGTLHRGRSSLRINPWLIAGVIALVILGVVLLKIISNATNKASEEQESQTQTQVLTPSEQAQGAAVGGSGSAIDVSSNQTSVQSNQAVQAGMGIIDIWSKGDVNIKITDKNGHVLMQGVQSRGGYQLEGEPPLAVEIDKPAQVDINFNQKPIRLGEHTTNGRASLTLQ